MPSLNFRETFNWKTELFRNGFCIIPEAVPVSLIERLNTELEGHFAHAPFCDGDFYGRQTKRFGSLLTRSTAAAEIVQHPQILQIADAVLGSWCDRFNLNLTQGIEIHPGAPAQYPHRDQDMWDGAKGEIEYLLNVMWPLSSFTSQNGATRLWPHSNYPGAQDSAFTDAPVIAEMEPGSVLLFLGSTLHGGGANHSSSARRGIIISYCLGWLKPFENQWLCYPPHVARHFPPELAALAGYSVHRPNLGNFEGQSPAVLLANEPAPSYLAAKDALRPDQDEALAAFMAAAPGTGSQDADDDGAGT